MTDDRRRKAFYDREAQIKALRRLGQEAHVEAFRAMNAGTADLAQYKRLAGDLAAERRALWAPTLTVAQTRRDLGLGQGPRYERVWMQYLVGDLLSHGPGERVSSDLKDKLKSVDELLSCEQSDPDLRLDAALARLAIGPGWGEVVRARLWDGKTQKLARKRFCDHRTWWNRGLLGVWPEIDRHLESFVLEAGAPPNTEGDQRVTTYEVIEQILLHHF